MLKAVEVLPASYVYVVYYTHVVCPTNVQFGAISLAGRAHLHGSPVCCGAGDSLMNRSDRCSVRYVPAWSCVVPVFCHDGSYGLGIEQDTGQAHVSLSIRDIYRSSTKPVSKTSGARCGRQGIPRSCTTYQRRISHIYIHMYIILPVNGGHHFHFLSFPPPLLPSLSGSGN